MAEKKELIPEMRDSTVSLIYKDKGKITDIGKYRPIAVNSIIYRIMAKTIVVYMGPLLSTVTSANQKHSNQENFYSPPLPGVDWARR